MAEQNTRTFFLGILGGALGAVATAAAGFAFLLYAPAEWKDDLPVNTLVLQEQVGGDEQLPNQGRFIDDVAVDVPVVVDKVNPSVVSVVVSRDVSQLRNQNSRFQDFFESLPFGFELEQNEGSEGGVMPVQVAAGTGFVVTPDGMIMTNRHVVRDEQATYTVVFADGSEYTAQVLARDPLLDIAVLKIDATDLTPVTFGNSDTLQKGQTVIAIGNTLGEYENTVTRGIISGLARSIGGEYTGLIQTDAAINEGNSGGPLLNARGEAIGINTAVDRAGEGIGFAIPANEAKVVLESLQKEGRIVRPALGIRYVQITPELAQVNNFAYDYGAYIRGTSTSPGVIPGSAADAAGLREGDIILEVEGQKVTEQQTLASLIRQKRVGERIKIRYARGGEILEATVQLAELPEMTNQ